MAHKNDELLVILRTVDLGSSVAELDSLLGSARVETSAFTDLYADRVDLVPGTKGSGKSALFRIFVEFLPSALLDHRKVIVAHGVQSPGDPVFNAYAAQFAELEENDFVAFWCVYLVSLAHEQFVKDPRYAEMLAPAAEEVRAFRRACVKAGIPEIKARKSLRDVLEWSLRVLKQWRPKLKLKLPDDAGEFETDLFGAPMTTPVPTDQHPLFLNEIQVCLEAILKKVNLSLWLMVDRLDEIFPRRSAVERTALRALLNAMRYFASPYVRVKIFLRDDMLDHIVRTEDGFTALTHVTARQSDTLRWTKDQILTMVTKRFFSNATLAAYLNVDPEKIAANSSYRQECFYRVFPKSVYRGPKQSSTMDWLYGRCADGRGVVTPRDVLDLLLRAKQKQQDLCSEDAVGFSSSVIGGTAIQYGMEELSKRKRQTYLQAEFPHLWSHMEKFVGGKTEYSTAALESLLGKGWKAIADDLAAIGFFSVSQSKPGDVYWVPYLYRYGMDLTQGKA